MVMKNKNKKLYYFILALFIIIFLITIVIFLKQKDATIKKIDSLKHNNLTNNSEIRECIAYSNLTKNNCKILLSSIDFIGKEETIDSCIFDAKLKEIIDKNEINKCIEISKLKKYTKYDNWVGSLCFLALIENEKQCNDFVKINEGKEYDPKERKKFCNEFIKATNNNDFSKIFNVSDDFNEEDKNFLILLNSIKNKEPKRCENLKYEYEIDEIIAIKKCQILAGQIPDKDFCTEINNLVK